MSTTTTFGLQKELAQCVYIIFEQMIILQVQSVWRSYRDAAKWEPINNEGICNAVPK